MPCIHKFNWFGMIIHCRKGGISGDAKLRANNAIMHCTLKPKIHIGLLGFLIVCVPAGARFFNIVMAMLSVNLLFSDMSGLLGLQRVPLRPLVRYVVPS